MRGRKKKRLYGKRGVAVAVREGAQRRLNGGCRDSVRVGRRYAASNSGSSRYFVEIKPGTEEAEYAGSPPEPEGRPRGRGLGNRHQPVNRSKGGQSAVWSFSDSVPEGLKDQWPRISIRYGIPWPVASQRDRMTACARAGHSIPSGWESPGNPEPPD
jgi:hypothetical protein